MEHLGRGITLLPGFEKIPLLLDKTQLSDNDELNFNTFPQRHGWQLRDDGRFGEKSCTRHKRKDSMVCHGGNCLTNEIAYDRTTWARLGAFLQRWLFFEVLHEFFDDGINQYKHSDFIKPSGMPDKTWVTTEKLNEYLKNWEKYQRSPSWMGTPRQRAKLIRTQHVLDRSRFFISKYCAAEADFYWYIDQDIALSLMVLGEALTHAFVRLQRELRIIPEGWYDLDVSTQSYGYSAKVLDDLMEKGWCLRTISMLKTLMKGNTIGLLLVLPHVTQAHMHVNCTEKVCFARQTKSELDIMKKEKNPEVTTELLKMVSPDVTPTHMGPKFCKWQKNKISEEQCPMKGPETHALLEIILNEGVPLLWWDEERNCIQLEPMYNWDKEYVVFSHVWSDGYGNNGANKMHECAVKALDETCQKVWEKAASSQSRRSSRAQSSLHSRSVSRSASRPLSRVQSESKFFFQALTQLPTSKKVKRYFWIDTLAVPVGKASEEKNGRRIAISKMHQIYRHASYTVVFEKGLSKVPMHNSTTGAVKISVSRWMSRLWTLQEGVLSTHLLFNFSDNLYSLDEIEYAMVVQEIDDGADIHKCVSRVAQAYYDGLLGNHRTHLGPEEQVATAEFVASLWRAVQWRRLSKMRHQTLALSILLGIDTNDIAPEVDVLDEDVRVTDPRHTRPMEKLFECLAKNKQCAIPAGIVFLPGPKLLRKGYRWAPANWLIDQATLSPDPLAVEAASPKFLFERDGSLSGIVVAFPGLVLHKLADFEEWFLNPDDFHFPVHRTLNDWYRIRRTDGAPFPTTKKLNGRTVAIITMQWPLLHGEEIALLVAADQSIKPVPLPKEESETGTGQPPSSFVTIEILNHVWISREHKPSVVEDRRGQFRERDFGAMFCGEPIGLQHWLIGGHGTPDIEQGREEVTIIPKPANPFVALVRRATAILSGLDER